MRVILPFVAGHLEDGVYEAISASGYAVELHDVSGSDTAYHRLLAELWRCDDDVTIVEQDIRIGPSTLDAFVDCPNGWCSAQYRYLGSENYTGLGCTRFRREFMLAHPDVIVAAGEYEDPTHTRGFWCTQDFAIQNALRLKGVHVCVHGHVDHLGDLRPTHNCCG